MSGEPRPYTRDQLDAGLIAIFGERIAETYTKGGGGRPRGCWDAASRMWMTKRPEDDHAAVIRTALDDLNERGHFCFAETSHE